MLNQPIKDACILIIKKDEMIPEATHVRKIPLSFDLAAWSAQYVIETAQLAKFIESIKDPIYQIIYV